MNGPEPDHLREIVGAAALIMRTTGERWTALAREDLSERELEAAWSEDAELLCAALGTLVAEREG